MSSKIFIVGVGRSGTSLLQAMLASHAHVGFLPETSFFRRYIGNAIAAKGSPESLRARLKSDCRLKRIHGIESKIDEIELKKENCFLDVYESLFDGFDSCRWVGDKDPRNVELISVMSAIWSDAKFVHLIRDPRDVLVSKKKAKWSSGRRLLFYLIAGQAQVMLAERATKRIGRDRILKLRYEDLVDDAKNQLGNVCRWIGLDFDEGMLSFNTAAGQLVAEDEMQWKKETLGRLITRNHGKWKHGLSAFEIVATERACQAAMRSGGYVTEDQVVLTRFEKLKVRFVALSCKLAAWIYVVRRERMNRRLSARYGRS